MLTSTTMQLTGSEKLLWTVLHNFEALALRQYKTFIPSLVTDKKRELVQSLHSQVPDDSAMNNTNLAEPVKNLLEIASGSSQKETLLIQGLLLEILGSTIYETFKDSNAFSEATHQLCILGLEAQDSIRATINSLIEKSFVSKEEIYSEFINISKPVIMQLDTLGDSLDQHFSEQFNISFSELMGSFVAELMTVCTSLGMDRRRLVGYLTSILMGI